MSQFAEWEVSLVFTSDDGCGISSATVSCSGIWNSESRPMLECIALTMGSVLRGLEHQCIHIGGETEVGKCFMEAYNRE